MLTFFICSYTERRSLKLCFFFSSRRRHTRFDCDWSSDVCSSDLIVEVAGHLYAEPPKNRKHRKTIYPRHAPSGYPLAADKIAARIDQARTEQAAGTNPLGLIFPSTTGQHCRSSNFRRSVLGRAYQAAGWRDQNGNGHWTWHSLRHVFCTTALFTWKLDPTDVSRMAGHSTYRTTLDMYVNSQELHQTGVFGQVSRSQHRRNSVPLVPVLAL